MSIISAAAVYAAFKAAQAFLASQEKQKEYSQFFDLTLDVLSNDTAFLRSELFRSIGLVPETSKLNQQIIEFEGRLEAVRNALRENKLIME